MSNDKKSEKIEDRMKERSKFEAFCLPFSSKFLQGNSDDQKIMQMVWQKVVGFRKTMYFFVFKQYDRSYLKPHIVCVTLGIFFGLFRNVMQIMNIWSRYWMDWNTQTIKNEGNLGRYKKNNFSLTLSLSLANTHFHTHTTSSMSPIFTTES